MRVVVHVLIMQGVGRGMMAVFCFDSDIVSQPRYGYHQRYEHLVPPHHRDGRVHHRRLGNPLNLNFSGDGRGRKVGCGGGIASPSSSML